MLCYIMYVCMYILCYTAMLIKLIWNLERLLIMQVSLYSFRNLLHIIYIDHSKERTRGIQTAVTKTFRLCQKHFRDVTDMCCVIIYHYQWCIWQSPCCPLPQHSAVGYGPQGPAHTGLPPSYAAPSTAEKKLPVNQTNTEINSLANQREHHYGKPHGILITEAH